MQTTQAVRRTLGVLLLIGSLSTVACSSATTKTTPAASIPPVVHTDPAGKFTAEFPSAPLREEEKTTVSGLDLLIVSFTTENGTESVVVGYTDYPKNLQMGKVLDAAAQGSADNIKGTLQSKTSTTFMGHPTMDVVVKTPEAMVHERLILRGNRLYTLVGVGATGKPASYDRLVQTFVLI